MYVSSLFFKVFAASFVPIVIETDLLTNLYFFIQKKSRTRIYADLRKGNGSSGFAAFIVISC